MPRISPLKTLKNATSTCKRWYKLSTTKKTRVPRTKDALGDWYDDSLNDVMIR